MQNQSQEKTKHNINNINNNYNNQNNYSLQSLTDLRNSNYIIIPIIEYELNGVDIWQ